MVVSLRKRPKIYAFARRHLRNSLIHRASRHLMANEGGGAGHWDMHVALVESKSLKGWLDWDFIEEEHIRPQVSGDRTLYYLQYFFRNHLTSMPVKRALSVGCGGGNLERALIQLNAAEKIDAFDASPESIRLARELAGNAGIGSHQIRYEVENINEIRLEPGAYDFVIAKMSLHHFENLEHVYDEIRRSLKPGGVFMFNEFVGPSRFQWTDLQLELANELLRALPERHRWSAHSGTQLSEIGRPTVAEMIEMDPTEAVRSADIMPVLDSFFEIVERKDYGGTLLHLLLTHVMASFDLNDERQASLLRTIFLFERTLIAHKVLPSDFTYVVARPRS